MAITDRAFLLSDLEVVRFRASQGSDTDEHIHWHVGYAPEPEEHLPDTMRVVIGDLHVGGENGYAEISVGSLFIHNDDDLNDENLAQAITDADATETLYDFARSHISSFVGILKIGVDLPIHSPEPEVSMLVRAPEADEDKNPSVRVDEPDSAVSDDSPRELDAESS